MENRLGGESDTKALRIRIRGRVQGVGFRFHAVRLAEEHGISGWVRNNPDGTVESFAEGEERVLDRFLEGLREGPSASRVDDVEIRETDPSGELSGFRVRY